MMTLEEKLKELEHLLEMEKQVKANEVQINKSLQETIEKLLLQNDTLIRINEDYSNTIGKLRARLKELIVKS
jgi:thiamine kinase-like enzyme